MCVNEIETRVSDVILFDNQMKRIVRVSKSQKSIWLLASRDLNVLKTIRFDETNPAYNIDIDRCCLTPNNELAFVNDKTRKIKFLNLNNY